MTKTMTEEEKKEILKGLEGNMIFYKQIKDRRKELFCGRLINKLKYSEKWK